MHLISWETLDGDADQIKIRLQRDTFVSDYAILSHRWGKPEDEVSYEDMLVGGYEHKQGYAKLVGCCKQARGDGLHHVWVDTCCINKSSSAELSESITSMFAYYERAKVCYAFLDDVSFEPGYATGRPPKLFAQSAWFTRGWTLQELIAPKHVKFFDQSWYFLGYKTDKHLLHVIENATNVDSIVLNVPATTKVMSIAKKMSWVSRRQTTRVEDMAYSLMGIFGVYMPPLYGEGTHAFIRLQEAIMKTSNDQTIFAWTSPPAGSLSYGFEHVSTMLALSPRQFEDSSGFEPLSHGEHNKFLAMGGCKLDYATTNSGLAIRLPLFRIHAVEGLYAAFLACTESKDRVPSAILLRTSTDMPPGHFWRTNSSNGPIERSLQRWFEVSGREAITAQDIYVLPRFTSVSEQKIEPPWKRVDMEEVGREVGASLVATQVLGRVQHVPDPGINELTFLHQAHQMIHTRQADKLVDRFKLRLRFSLTTLPARNRFFYGRANVLQNLTDTFFPSERIVRTGPTVCTISGMGGIGKTQIAIEFSHHCVQHHIFDTVVWIQADSYTSLIKSFSTIDSKFSLVRPGSSDEAIIEAVKLWLSNLNPSMDVLSTMTHSDDWRLVFDNVDDASLLTPFFPSNGTGCVLVISRDPGLWFVIGSDNVTVEPFTTQESSGFLRTLTRIDGDFTDISKGLGGLPLALSQVAAVIVRRGLSLDEFTRLFNQAEIDDQPQQLDNQDTLSLCWESAFRGMSSSSLAVLQVISYLDPDFIEDSILVASSTMPLADFPMSEHDLIGCREELLRRSLLARSAARDGVQAHRLIQQAVRRTMDPEERKKALSTAVELVSSSWARLCSEQPRVRKAREKLIPHVLHQQAYDTDMVDLDNGLCTKRRFLEILEEIEVWLVKDLAQYSSPSEGHTTSTQTKVLGILE
ncbi:Hypothetical protein NCS54_01355600 [Fusarium falciforme]|uniref:Hypothetical protein n=1 Tax=Fusarium falciforme TaxID=195108 RepID=UPI0022FFDE4D|nr:Hypothetical protein NCS54_01355600 [Fusarium falciforme]WAO95908.1 Hypothetical protein NCS54_01355600 [Fusarium falciforme]